MIVRSGDPIRLGAEIGFAMEPQLLFGRLVGICHRERGLQRYVVRSYQPSDVLGIPTGPHRTTADVWLVPWEPPPGFDPDVPPVVLASLVPTW